MSVHSTAIIEEGAKLGSNVSIGAFAYIGPHVVLGDGCRVHHHATVDGFTTLGENCEVFSQAVLGAPPQDVKYRGERTTLEIGHSNVFREMVTAHPGTGNGGGVTRIGDNNLFLIGVHVAHDCQIGSQCIFANYVQFAGHVKVEDHVNMGGHSAVHHFVTIGRHAFIGGMTRIAADVPPFLLVVAARGTRSEVRMVNGVGLQRNGYSNEDIGALKTAFMKLFSRKARQSGTAISERVQAIMDKPAINPHVLYLCESLMRSFAHGRHGRYLESLRSDPVHRNTWKPDEDQQLKIKVIGNGIVADEWHKNNEQSPKVVKLTAKADVGWAFAGWNGSLDSKANPVDIVLDQAKQVTATFTLQSTKT